MEVLTVDTIKQALVKSRVIAEVREEGRSEILLGFQMLGMGRYDEAEVHLHSAQLNRKNNKAATLLLNLLKKIKSTSTSDMISKSD